MHQRLLVARQNDFDFILFVKLIADINGAGSRITEEILNTLLLQSLYQKFVSCNLFHMKPPVLNLLHKKSPNIKHLFCALRSGRMFPSTVPPEFQKNTLLLIPYRI